jgi:hypothetical protein
MSRPPSPTPPPPPPPDADRESELLSGCAFSRASIGADYPALAGFVAAVAGQDAELLFPTGEDALAFVLSLERCTDPQALRERLREEARRFAAAFPSGDPCRQQGWWALGANAGAPAFIAAMLHALAAPEG